MRSTKEEIGATAAAGVYCLAMVVSMLHGASLGNAAFRGALCAAGASLLGQFLGSIWLKAEREGNPGESSSSP